MDTVVFVLIALGAPALAVLTWKFPVGMGPPSPGVTLSLHPSFLPSLFALFTVLGWGGALDQLGVLGGTGLVGDVIAGVLFVGMVLGILATLHGLGAGFLYPAIPFLVPPRAREKARRERDMRRRRREKRRQEV
ncbi:hypothetical protein [Nesterenkonia flava]|uniref:Uncharacterized protein n=1 Tax=Nesterenkonia flava TaxID=469799 RepID=A0ABU1FRI9_9MICC|nr:hypothetical protein [Nesterenkonia flava]MDR5710942.1 hypothetical protein [Nesterenkonia flava]